MNKCFAQVVISICSGVGFAFLQMTNVPDMLCLWICHLD